MTKESKSLSILVMTALLSVAACNRHPANSTALFPATNEIAGWVRQGNIRSFEAGELWKYVDGEAERYLKGDAQGVSTADYKFQDKIDAVVDIYLFENAAGAEKLLESEPTGDAKPCQLGDASRLYGQSLVFRRRTHLVRIVAYEESADVQTAILELGKGIDRRLASDHRDRSEVDH